MCKYQVSFTLVAPEDKFPLVYVDFSGSATEGAGGGGGSLLTSVASRKVCFWRWTLAASYNYNIIMAPMAIDHGCIRLKEYRPVDPSYPRVLVAQGF